MPVVQTNFRIRKNFGKIEQLVDIPNLIDIQKQSYEKFLQANVLCFVNLTLNSLSRFVKPLDDAFDENHVPFEARYNQLPSII